MGKKVVKTLYFINGVAPSEEQQAEINAMPGNVCVRNALKIREEETVEDFDYVAGDVPDNYRIAAKDKPDALDDDEPAEPPLASTGAPAAPHNAPAKPTGTGTKAWKPA